MKEFDYDAIKTLGIKLTKNDNDFNGRRQNISLWIKEIQIVAKKNFVEDENIKKLQNIHDVFEGKIDKDVKKYNETAEAENVNGLGAILGMPKSNKILSELNNLLNQKVYKIIEVCSDIEAFSERKANIQKDRVPKTTLLNENVFIVHGHNSELKQTVARVLTKLKFNPIILHEYPNSGKTIIEKFEELADTASYAVILLSDDDLGKSKLEDKCTPRARQNVIMELGYFIGKLGRKKVFVLKYGEIEVPSDVIGVVYNNYDGEEGGWVNKLIRDMKSAGFSVDANNLV